MTADHDEVRVNGELANYKSKLSNTDVALINSANEATVIPEGYHYILSDRIASSVDSRSLGLLPQTEVLGKVATVIKKPW